MKPLAGGAIDDAKLAIKYILIKELYRCSNTRYGKYRPS